MRTMMASSSVAAALAGLCLLAGCGGKTKTGDQTEKTTDKTPQGHSHADADKLFWDIQDVERQGFLISVGRHGEHIHAGNELEPAVMVTRDGEDVGDAEVFHSLRAEAEDGSTELAAEVKTVYEPKTAEEPAHYAGAKLAVPKDARKGVIHYRIKLPGVEKEEVFDVKVEFHEPD